MASDLQIVFGGMFAYVIDFHRVLRVVNNHSGFIAFNASSVLFTEEELTQSCLITHCVQALSVISVIWIFVIFFCHFGTV